MRYITDNLVSGMKSTVRSFFESLSNLAFLVGLGLLVFQAMIVAGLFKFTKVPLINEFVITLSPDRIGEYFDEETMKITMCVTNHVTFALYALLFGNIGKIYFAIEGTLSSLGSILKKPFHIFLIP